MESGLHPRLLAMLREAAAPLEPLPTGEARALNRLAGIRAVLFDLYGTLFLSSAGDLGLHEDSGAETAFAEALAAAGLAGGGAGVEAWKNLIRDDHRRRKAEGERFPEVDIREIWFRFGQQFCPGAPADPDAPAWSVAALAYEIRVNRVWPAPGAAELLESLRARGLRLGIVSNAQFYTPLLFEAYLGAPHADLGFDPDLCVFSYELRSAKPSPAMFAGVLDRLRGRDGIPSDGVVYVGNDMLKDIHTASAAGCRTVLYAGDRRSLRKRRDHPDCANLNPDATITSLDQLEACLA